MFQSESPQLEWTITDLTGNPVDLTGDAPYLIAYTPGRNPAGMFVVATNRFTVNTNGTLSANLSDPETAISRTLAYAIWTSPSSTAVIVARGRLEIKAMVKSYSPLYGNSSSSSSSSSSP